MAFNSFGKLLTVTTFGESHGKALGCVVDGFPSKIKIDEDAIQREMDRRRPGSTSLGTKRDEKDKIKILSGIFDGISTGTPIAIVVENENQRSNDYSALEHLYRPGHADYTFDQKYGIRDYRGGGRSSGRETLARVAAGALAKQLLKEEGIEISAAIVQIGDIKATNYNWNPPFSAPLYAPECNEKEKMIQRIERAKASLDSVGALIECHIDGVPAGLGDPVFSKLDANLACAIFSIGAVKGFEIGSGFSSIEKSGSENNDQMGISNGSAYFKSNNAGGILGGISNGNQIMFKVAFKPTPSIALEQETIDDDEREQTIKINGRHDPCIGPRAVVVVEAMAALVIADELLLMKAYKKTR